MQRRQLILFGAIFAAVVLVLSALYFAFLRPGYAVLYEDIREADAAEIVTVLDQQGIEYRLEDNGHRIRVPEDEVGRARVLVAGSGVAMGGVVGFELFNETDMGLTEFAQKVNYQRALQGELARTIMGMDGVAFARVHLSLPERTLFRANQTGPKAAVTLQTETGAALDPARVVGVQQLVSAAVTDLPSREVAVIDQRGRLLSAAPIAGQEPGSELDERSALEEYYRARARSIAERLVPGLPFDVRVLAMPIGEEAPPALAAAAPGAEPTAAPSPAPSTAGGGRDFSLRIAFRTEMELPAEDLDLLREAITRATDLQAGRGDTLRFETGPLEQYEPAAAAAAVSPPEPISGAPLQAAEPFGEDLLSHPFGEALFWPAVGILIVLALILLRRRSRLSADEQQSFADQLSENLALEGGLGDGR